MGKKNIKELKKEALRLYDLGYTTVILELMSRRLMMKVLGSFIIGSILLLASIYGTLLGVDTVWENMHFNQQLWNLFGTTGIALISLSYLIDQIKDFRMAHYLDESLKIQKERNEVLDKLPKGMHKKIFEESTKLDSFKDAIEEMKLNEKMFPSRSNKI